jgi:hypothetical protein
LGTLLGAHRLELLRRGVATVGLALGQQRARHLGVPSGPLELEHRRLVGHQPEPAEAVEDRVDRPSGRPLPVGVLDPQQVAPAVVPREQPVEQGRARAADVQVTRR